MKRFSSGVMWGALLFFALGYLLVLVGRSQPHVPAIRRFGFFDHGRMAFEVYGYDVAMNQGSRWVMFYSKDGSLIARLNIDSGLIWKEIGK